MKEFLFNIRGAAGRDGIDGRGLRELVGRPGVFELIAGNGGDGGDGGGTGNDPDAVKLTGAQSIAGLKTFLDGLDIPDASLPQAKVAGLGAAFGLKADLVDGKVPTSQLPPITGDGNLTHVIGSQAAMLALTATQGDVAVRTDFTPARQYRLSTGSPSTLADWIYVSSAGQVDSVNGQAGVVTLGKANIGLGLVDNTSDLAKPISTAQAAVNATLAPKNNAALTGLPTTTTPTAGDNSTRIANTAWVRGELNASQAGLTESVQDIVGGMFTSSDGSVLAPYNDTTGKVDLTAIGGGGGEGKVDTALLGVANGVATLDSTGKVPTSQLPAGTGGGLPGANGGFSFATDPTDPGALIIRDKKYLAAATRAALNANRSASHVVISDSTGQMTSPRSWVYELADKWAAASAALTVRIHRMIGDAGSGQVNMPLRSFTRPATVIQTGTAGARRYNFSGTGSAQVNLYIGSVPLPASRDLDVRVYGVKPNSWTAGTSTFTAWNSSTAAQNLVSVFRTSSDGLTEARGWAFSLSGGALHVTHWNSPTSTVAIRSTFALPTGTAPFTTDTEVALRFELDADNGAGSHVKRAYWSGDGGATWTQAGTTATVAGVATYDQTAHTTVDVGAHSFGSFHRFAGRIGEVEIRDGIGGPTIAPTQLDNWITEGSGFTITGAPVLDIWNHSIGGSSVAGHLAVKDTKRGPIGALITFIADSHNEVGQGVSASYWRNLRALAEDARDKNPVGRVVIMSQNPRMAPAGNIEEHAARCLSLGDFADHQFDYIGVYEGWMEAVAAGAALDPMLTADGIHTETPGSELTAEIVWEHLA